MLEKYIFRTKCL